VTRIVSFRFIGKPQAAANGTLQMEVEFGVTPAQNQAQCGKRGRA
jgi:hypothetical protein